MLLKSLSSVDINWWQGKIVLDPWRGISKIEIIEKRPHNIYTLRRVNIHNPLSWGNLSQSLDKIKITKNYLILNKKCYSNQVAADYLNKYTIEDAYIGKLYLCKHY